MRKATICHFNLNQQGWANGPALNKQKQYYERKI
jgi:hypothetical protein